MRFVETPLSGAFVIEPELRENSGGFVATVFRASEFERRGLKSFIAQANAARSVRQGTLRGLHYQVVPFAETKLFRCTHGANFHVIVDLRSGSPTFLQHFTVELSAENRKSLYVPELFAHGYQTLTDEAEAAYQVGEFYQPGAERGLRYNDPALAIQWPLPVSSISPKDLSWSNINLAEALHRNHDHY